MSEDSKRTGAVLLFAGMAFFLAGNGLPQLVFPESLRDPTLPLGKVEVQQVEAKLELQAIKIRGERREAIINGQIVQVGDLVGEAKIVEIGDKYVIFHRAGRDHRLNLRSSVYTP